MSTYLPSNITLPEVDEPFEPLFGRVDLIEMLSYKRPGGSKTEEMFIERFVKPYAPNRDAYGNHYVLIEPDEDEPLVVWTAHTDTVHSKEGWQKVVMHDGYAMLQPKYRVNGDKLEFRGHKGQCLGADDGTGVFILLNMIHAGVPGLYVFHRDEECGCRGSERFVIENEGWLKSRPKAVVSFDRKGTKDIVTHQTGRRTASDAFARSLAAAIGLEHAPTDNGVYTDSNEYASLVPECTNVSVGYYDQHSSYEKQDLDFVEELVERMCTIDLSGLVIERDPTTHDDWAFGGFPFARRGGRSNGVVSRWLEDWGWLDDVDTPVGSRTRAGAAEDYGAMFEMVAEFPHEIVEILEEFGVTAEELADYIIDKTGDQSILRLINK